MPYITSDSQLLHPEAVFAHLKLRAGSKIADLGCGGHGQFTLGAARLAGTTGKVYAVDILKSALAEIAKKARLENLPNIKPIWANLEIVGVTAVPEASLDITLLINVLFQTRDRASIFREARRLLKPGGQLLVVEWKTTATPFGPPTDHRLSPDQVVALGTAARLQRQETFDAGKYHYGIVFTKS
ncbi:MAG: class I SAM-dependent methyltransferase [Patescibacteria group bacterium]|nr:class I SAM-dependent methyltransferase [Patescibacteria group bacterium]